MNKFLYYFFTSIIKYIINITLILFSFTFYLKAESGASVFMYHRFGESKYPSTNVTLEQFQSHIDYILANDYKILSLDEILKEIENDGKILEKAVAFSVDDAYSSFYEKAWPLFKSNQIPVTLFVSTNIIDQKTKGYMGWDDIKTFINEGGTIGQHTSTHMHMPLNEINMIKEDILDSHRSFLKNIGFIPNLFAYPYGETSSEVIGILKNFGITHAFGQHSGVISSSDNIYYLPRFSLNERFGEIDRFEFAVNANALQVKDFIPSEMFLKKNKKPVIEFGIETEIYGNKIECFSNPGGNWGPQEVINITKSRVQIKLSEEFLPGRARINCTVKVNDKWYWYGYQFLIK